MMNDPFSSLRHDLRTPINHILGYSELLQEELADGGGDNSDAYTGDLQKIRSAADTLLSLINTHLTPEGIAALSGAEPHTSPSSLPTTAAAPTASAPSPSAPPLPAADDDPAALLTGKILVVDDNPDNRETLCRRLQRQGHTTAEAAHGREALARLRLEAFDLVLLDVMMPELDGYAVLHEMKRCPELKEIPVIMISALDELGSVVRCIENGAEDYLSKPFQPTLLRARIGASLEKKTLRDLERLHLRTIEETQRRLSKELEEAGNYVRSILPPIATEPFAIDWRFIPSTELGGDSFGYHWIDNDHFAIYLLDVCGHGVGAALLSVAAINVLRSGSLATDFRDPAGVLSLLNETFPMERHNNMYFTIWYGVFHRPTRTLRHASGGHPAALLVKDGAPLQPLRCPGLVVGVMPDIPYQSDTTAIPAGSRLFILSDGTYEIRTPTGMLAYEEFEAFVHQHGTAPDALDRIVTWVTSLNGTGPLDDDFSIITIDL